jgi:hypothetical protein
MICEFIYISVSWFLPSTSLLFIFNHIYIYIPIFCNCALLLHPDILLILISWSKLQNLLSDILSFQVFMPWYHRTLLYPSPVYCTFRSPSLRYLPFSRLPPNLIVCIVPPLSCSFTCHNSISMKECNASELLWLLLNYLLLLNQSPASG